MADDKNIQTENLAPPHPKSIEAGLSRVDALLTKLQERRAAPLDTRVVPNKT